MNRFRFVLCVVALLGLDTAARAAQIEIIQPWVRVTPGQSTGALYFTIHNGGAQADRLVGASTPMARRAELHSSVEQGNVVRMEKIDGVEIAAGGSAAFQPGGLHVMLIGLEPNAVPGQMLQITLRFERAGELKVAAPILAPGGKPPAPSGMGAHGAPGGGMEHGAQGAHGPHKAR
jgi:copper(I)-binding protein